MTSQGSEVFESYAQEFQDLKSSVKQRLDSDAVQQRGEQRKALLRRVTMDIEEMEEIVAQMEGEAKGKARLTIRVRSLKSEIQGLQARVSSLSTVSDRDLLLSQPAHSAYVIDADADADDDDRGVNQRSRLLATQQTLQTSSNRLENAERTAAESEVIGGSILGQLRSQRTQLEGANDELEDAQQSISKASVTIKKMIRLASRQRIVLTAGCVVLGLIVIFILWRKLAPH